MARIKNNKLLWIIVIIVLLIYYMEYYTPKKTAFADYSSLGQCEEERSNNINVGYQCVAECKQVTQTMKTCLDNIGFLGWSVGEYIYYHERSYTCEYAYNTWYKDKLDCVYGGIPGHETEPYPCLDPGGYLNQYYCQAGEEKIYKCTNSGWQEYYICLPQVCKEGTRYASDSSDLCQTSYAYLIQSANYYVGRHITLSQFIINANGWF